MAPIGTLGLSVLIGVAGSDLAPVGLGLGTGSAAVAEVKEGFQREKVEEESGRESSGPEGAAIVKAGPLVTAERESVILSGVAEGQR